jgi:predicted phage terminase large subunit-like protein
MWARCPAWRAIFLSANPRVALRDSVYCRDVIESDWYRDWFRPDWELAEDQNAKGLYRNTRGGYRQAMGFNSRITGDRADAILVDDPHDAQEAESDAIRQGVLDRWDSAIANRLNDLRSSVRIGIMQRLHSEDWSGHVLKSGVWEHLCIPQEFEPKRARTTCIGWTDPRKESGELLFPKRFTPEILRQERARLGSYGYAGQHQQQPVPSEGGVFKHAWFRYWRPDAIGCVRCSGSGNVGNAKCRRCSGSGSVRRYHLLRKKSAPKIVEAMNCRHFGIVDLAFSTRTSADFTVITAWAATPDSDLVLLDMDRRRLEGPDILPAIQAMSDKHRLDYVGIEEVSAQLLVVQTARRAGLTIRGLAADKDKRTRALPMAIRMENEQVFMPEGFDKLPAIEAELLEFDRGAHDDIVDNFAYAGAEVQRFGGAPEPDDVREAREQAEQAEREREWHDPSNPAWWE